MSLSNEMDEQIRKRNAQIYADYLAGKRYKHLVCDYDLSMSTIKRILMEYRIDHNLPNGRKYAIA